MKLKVDRQADALYLTLSEAPSSRSEEVSPGISVPLSLRPTARVPRAGAGVYAGTSPARCPGSATRWGAGHRHREVLVRRTPGGIRGHGLTEAGQARITDAGQAARDEYVRLLTPPSRHGTLKP